MCSEGKYELPRASGQEKGRKSLANKENQTERNPAADFIFFLKNILYAAPVNTASKCEAHTPLLHIILYFVVDALCIQSILVDKLHCRS